MFDILWPWSFALLPLPILVVLLPRAPAHQVAALRVPFYEQLVSKLIPTAVGASKINMFLVGLIWLLLVLAACRPQWLGAPVSIPVSGRDLLMAVDISGSMKVNDLSRNGAPRNRLDVVKDVAGEFIRRRQGDRIGLVLFGTRAYLQAPLTFDRVTVQTLLNESEIGLAGERTAIGDAIGLAVKRLRMRPQNNRVLILITDGANTAGAVKPLKAAELAKQEGLKIYTIGIGAEQMIVRDFFGTRRINPSADLDEKTLTEIAGQTNGRYFRASDREQLEDIYAMLDKIEPVIVDPDQLRPVIELFVWPLGLALFIVLIASMVSIGLFIRFWNIVEARLPVK